MSSYRQALKVARTEHIRKLVDNNQNNPRFLFSTVARLTNLRHPRRTPWVPNGTGQRCVGRYCVPEPHSLGCWQKWVVGKSEEAERRTLSSHGPENPEEKEIALSLRKWVPLALRRLPGRFGAWLGRGGAALEGAHGDGQTEAWPQGQRWSVRHAGAGCAGSPRSAAVPPRTLV